MNENKLNEALKPADQLIISTPETLKVIADPVRLQIIDLLTGEPRTVKQVAAELGIALSKMYYHINLLEEHGLIRVVSTRMVSNLMEKLYQAAAYSFTTERALLTFSDSEGEGGLLLVSSVFDMAKNEIKRSLDAGLIEPSKEAPLHRSLTLGLSGSRLRPEQANEFYRRFQELVKEFNDADNAANDAEAAPYAILLSIFPAKEGRISNPDETEYG